MSKPQTVLDVLNAMDEKFSDASKWTQGWYFKDIHGQKGQDVSSSDNTCWCVLGCIRAVAPPKNTSHLFSEIGIDTALLLERILGESAATWNDSPARTFEEVKQLIRRAKEQAK